MKNRLLLLLAPALLLTACNTDRSIFNSQITEIQDYIATTGLEFENTESGLHYHILEPGNTNRIPDEENLVSFKHIGYLLDSTIFSNGWSPSPHVSMYDLVPGFREGLTRIGEGGRAIVIFPSELGYGANARGLIPENSILMFDVELVSYY